MSFLPPYHFLDEKNRLQSMQKAMASLAQPDAAKKIASLVWELAERTDRQ